MFTKNMRRALMCGSALVIAAGLDGAAGQAFAQSSGDSAGSPETVTVTGSMVITDIAKSPSPITSLSTDVMEDTTPSNVADALIKLPMFGANFNPSYSNGAAANYSGNFVNLRGMDKNRTLVLLDGHRVAPANTDESVDIDTLPQMLMSRVDIVTGGASAVYGSNAVTGVVNFILDKNFDGFKYNFNAGTSTEALGTGYKAEVAAGSDLFGGRGHWEMSASFAHKDAIPLRDMPYSKNGQAWALTGNGSQSSPYTAVQYSRNSTYSWGGIVNCTCAAKGMTFTDSGILGPLQPSAASGSYNDVADYSARFQRAELFGRFSYDISDSVVASVNLTGATAQTLFRQSKMQILTGANPNTFYVTNPFLSADARALLSSGNTAGTFQLAEQLDNFSDGNALAMGDILKVGTNVRYLAATADLAGQAWGEFDWDIYYTHGDSRDEVYVPQNINNQKLYAALDAVPGSNGTVVCYVSTTANAGLYPGCVPFDPFGRNAPSSAAFQYVTERTQYTMKYIMDDGGGSIAGNVFELPAGPARLALSGEARWIDYGVNTLGKNSSDLVDCTGLRLCSASTTRYVQGTYTANAAGYSVWEFALEGDLPILKDLPLVQELDLNLAGRYTDYSNSGGVETWKIGPVWRVNDSIAFRGVMSMDIKAPTANNTTMPITLSQSTLTDRLTGVTGTATLIRQGNPNLVPEEAHNYTAGVVLTPSFIPGFSLTADYYRIRVKGGIGSINYNNNDIQNLCLAAIKAGTGSSSSYCALAVRPNGLSNDPSNFPTAFYQLALNAASINTEGVDIGETYNFDLQDIIDGFPGSVTTHTLLSLQPYITATSYPGSTPYAYLGPMPKAKVAAFIGYNLDNWSFNLQWTYNGSYTLKSSSLQYWNGSSDAGAFNVFDVTVSRTMSIADGKANLYISVQNILDTQAPLDPATGPIGGGTYPTNRLLQSTQGRYFTIGIKGNL